MTNSVGALPPGFVICHWSPVICHFRVRGGSGSPGTPFSSREVLKIHRGDLAAALSAMSVDSVQTSHKYDCESS